MIKKIDVTAIGNAIVDNICSVSDVFLVEERIAKGAMSLIDSNRATLLSSKMALPQRTSGGSAANTIVGFVKLGGKGAYIGKVKNDTAGAVFQTDMKDLGVNFITKPSLTGSETAQCLIFVTPDAQRSMNTYLGACVDLCPTDIDPEIIKTSKVIYLEGYLWDPPLAKAAFQKAINLAHESGGKIALSLSDAFCVDRFRDEFLDLVENHVDILFANETEITSLYQVDNFDAAVALLPNNGCIVALTRGANGSVVVQSGKTCFIPPNVITKLVDTTGAGDLYASGFLYGYINNNELSTCGKLGGLVASEIITHFGARPKTDLKSLLASIKESG